MSTGRTTTQPEVDTVNWLSSIDQQKHGTVFNLSLTAVFSGVHSRAQTSSTSVLQPAAANCSSLKYVFSPLFLFCLPELLVKTSYL